VAFESVKSETRDWTPGVLGLVCNPSAWRWRKEYYKFKASLGYKVRLSQIHLPPCHTHKRKNQKGKKKINKGRGYSSVLECMKSEVQSPAHTHKVGGGAWLRW
jgi:hypothetical protein